MKKLLVMVVSLVLFAGVQSANAISLIDVDGDWTGTTGGYDVQYPTGVAVSYGNLSQDQVTWGLPRTSGGQSGLGFTGVVGNGVGPEAVVLGTPFEIGQLVHFNYTIAAWSAATEAFMDLNMEFGDGTPETATVSLRFSVNETPNGDAPGGVPDIIGFPEGIPSQVITLDGVDYKFSFVGFMYDGNLQDEFVSPEGGSNEALLFGRLDEIRVPSVPAPGALLLGSIGAWVVGMARRRRAL